MTLPADTQIPIIRELDAPRHLVGERVVCTEVYQGMPDAEAVNTVTFTEEDGRTTMSILVQHGC